VNAAICAGGSMITSAQVALVVPHWPIDQPG